MSDTDVESDVTSGFKIPRFHGKRDEDYGLWRLRLRAACRVKGIWSVVDPTASSSITTDTTLDVAPDALASVRRIAKREKASGIIISALGDAPLRVVLDVDDDPARMLALLDARYASNRTVSRIAVQTQLFRMSYTEQNMSTYVDQYASLFAQLERMGKDAAIPETHKAPMLLASLDPQCSLEATAAALRTKDISELTWDYVATTLIDEYNAKQVSIPPSESGSRNRNRRRNRRKSGSASGHGDGSNNNHEYTHADDSSDVEITARALAVALKSIKSERPNKNSSHHCTFCDRSGHTEDRCFMNPDNPNNKLTPKMLELMTSGSKKSAPTSAKGKSGKVEFAGASVEKTTIVPPNDLRSYADSGATVHCFHSEAAFVPGSLELCETRTVLLADKTSVTATQCGEVIMPFENAVLRLKGALFLPSLGYNLVSTGRLADNGIFSFFRRSDVRLSSESDGFVLGTGLRDPETRMYMLPEPQSQSSSERALAVSDPAETELWHRRLAHINARDLTTVHQHADGVPKLCPMEGVCRACRLGKAHKLPFPGHFRRASAVGDIVHSDIVGPLELSFPDGFRYVSTFLDDHSRYVLIGLMCRKSGLGDAFAGASARLGELGGGNVTTQFCGSIIKVHSDGAKEYVALQNDLGGGGSNKSFSPPYTPELNAIAERVNRTMVEAARSLLIQADLPPCLWPFALKHVIHVRNRVPHSTIAATPFSELTGERPSLKNVRVFGCAAYVLRLPRGPKFESRALEGVYLETLEHGVYKVLFMDDDGPPRIMDSRHVTFDESTFPGAPGLTDYMVDESASGNDMSSDLTSDSSTVESDDSCDAFPVDIIDDESEEDDADVQEAPRLIDSDPELEVEGDDDGVKDDDEEDDDLEEQSPEESHSPEHDTPQSRYPRRNRRQTSTWYMATSAQCSTDVHITTSDEPTLREALNSTPDERNMWQSAVDEELASLESKNTWSPDDSPHAQPLPTHVVLKVKRKSDGGVERFKARVVAGGN